MTNWTGVVRRWVEINWKNHPLRDRLQLFNHKHGLINFGKIESTVINRKLQQQNQSTHPISGVFRFRKPLILRLILLVVVLAKFAAGDEPAVLPACVGCCAAAAAAGPPAAAAGPPPGGVATASAVSSMLGCCSLFCWWCVSSVCGLWIFCWWFIRLSVLGECVWTRTREEFGVGVGRTREELILLIRHRVKTHKSQMVSTKSQPNYNTRTQ